jgi:membrane-associated phospholipid phosphatase
VRAAREARDLGVPPHPTNGDQEAFPSGIANFTKSLPHDHRGEVEPRAYGFLLRALQSGRPEDLEFIPLGGFAKLANPQAAWAFELVGPDSCQPPLPPPPRFASAEQAAEIVELYWQALARDVPFAHYDANPLIARACKDLSSLADYRGPRASSRVTPATLFRGSTPGDLAGPYLTQFLAKDVPLRPLRVEQRARTTVPGVDYLTTFDEWLAVENGGLAGVNRYDEVPRYLRSGRDVAEYVHHDFSYQAHLGACLAALRWGVPPDGGNPYKHSRTQGAFATFGAPFLLYLLATVTQVALKASWYEKWRVHRRLRPEELAGRAQAQLASLATYPLHEDLWASAGLAAGRERWGSALLPQAYPEGCPTHPSYPAAHAVIAGACATVLKAAFDESWVVPDPVAASADGTELVLWKGEDLTVGGELNKLATNIAFARNFAGIHWRSDGEAGLRLGEAVALAVLDEQSLTENELFAGYSLSSFDGERIRAG